MALLVVAALLPLLLIAVTAAAARGAIPANGLVGIRTPATQRSEEAWRAAHRAALAVVVPGGVLVAVAGVVLAVLRRGSDATGPGLVLLGAFLVVALAGLALAQRAAGATARGGQPPVPLSRRRR